MMNSFEEKEKKQLIKKFHTLLSVAGMDSDDKKEILAIYDVTTSLDLTCNDLIEICSKLDSLINPKSPESDRLRKRVIASIFSWMQATGQGKRDIEYVKGIAFRASGCKSFNRIPDEKLRALYHAFCNKKNIWNKVTDIEETEIGRLTNLN